jgi:hypothetical protein
VHVWDAISIGGNVSSLREGGEEVGYRGKGDCGRWGAREGHGQSVDDHKLGVVVTRQWVELRVFDIVDWGAGGIVRHNGPGRHKR